MKIFVKFCFILFCSKGIACSGFPHAFCFTQANRPADLVVKGAVISAAAHSYQFKIIEILKGVETRSVVTIWDDKDFDGNGIVSMKVSDMASVGDTLLAVLPMIQTIKNTWDVIGDYARPHWLFWEPVIKISNNILVGRINGSNSLYDPYWFLGKLPYSEFKTFWNAHDSNCTKLAVGLNEEQTPAVTVIRQEGNQVKVSAPQSGNQEICVLAADGKKIIESKTSQECKLDLENFAAGLYVVCVRTEKGILYRKKIIR